MISVLDSIKRSGKKEEKNRSIGGECSDKSRPMSLKRKRGKRKKEKKKKTIQQYNKRKRKKSKEKLYLRMKKIFLCPSHHHLEE